MSICRPVGDLRYLLRIFGCSLLFPKFLKTSLSFHGRLPSNVTKGARIKSSHDKLNIRCIPSHHYTILS